MKNPKHQTICIRFANESSTIVGKTIESGSKPPQRHFEIAK